MSSLTKEEAQNVMDNFYPGCTLLFDGYVVGTCVVSDETGELVLSFSNTRYVSTWEYTKYLLIHRLRISYPKHPDGTDFKINDTQTAKSPNLQLGKNITKSKRLEARLKTASKIKTKVLPLPFPKGAS